MASMHTTPLWPMAVYFILVVILTIGMLGLSYLLGQRHGERATEEPYESGMLPTGSARVRLIVDYYLIAMFFVMFDLEAVFIFAWALAMRDVGWRGYVEVLLFIAVLMAALAYLWKVGALNWGAGARHPGKTEGSAHADGPQ